MGYKNKKHSSDRRLWVFFKVNQKHRSFSWPYVEQPSKSTTASNNLRLDDVIEIETSEIVQQKKN